jgi:hypothetical protein
MLHNLDCELEAVETLPYYEIFSNESEREKDIQLILDKKKKYLDRKHTILENIQLECERQKVLVSTEQKEIRTKLLSNVI